MDSKQHDDDAFGEFLLAHGPDVTPPNGFKEDLRQRLIAGLSEHQETPVRHRLLLHPWFVRSIAAAAMVMLVAGVSWWMAGGGVETAGADFAAVLRHIRDANWLEYDQVLRVPGAPETRIHVMMGHFGHSRAIHPDGRIIIENKELGRTLRLSPRDGTARIVSVPRYSTNDDPLERLRGAKDSDGRLAGTAIIAGREVLVYELFPSDDSMRVFVDPHSELPVKIEVEKQEAVLVLEGLTWNRPVSDSLFSVDVPEGYTLDMPTEESLIYLLRTCATLNGGRFPSRLDSASIVRLVMDGDQEEASRQVFPVGGGEPGQRTAETLRECLRGRAFIDAASENGGWQYSGAEATLGDAAKIICWWRPQGTATFRIVTGDLRIIDSLSPDQLPTEEPTPTGQP